MTENSTPPARAFGRRIDDLWLDGEEGKLHPAEWKLLRCAASGEDCVIGDVRPVTGNADNRIRPELLRFIALGGDADNPLHDHGILLAHAFVEGSLDFNGAVVPENFGLIDCMIEGKVDIRDCCTESFCLAGSVVEAIQGDRFESTGGLILSNGFQAAGEVRLLGAKIGGALDCRNARFDGASSSLNCDGIETNGTMFLNDRFFARDTVRVLGAKIGGDLVCRNGKFFGPQTALDTEGANVSGGVLLDHGFLAKGTVDLTNMQVGTSLRLTNGIFSAGEVAINAPNIKVGNSVYLNTECRVQGEISFQSAEIGDSITFQGGSFETKGAINLRNARIGNMLTWRGVEYARGELNLAGASCRSLNMDEAAWEKPSQIRLDNFVFERFAELPEGCDPAFWKAWLERQPIQHLTHRFRPNPYQQLAIVLDGMGHEEEARSVRIERRERQRLFTLNHVPKPKTLFAGAIRDLADFWRWVQKIFVAHGYRPGFAVVWLLGIVIAGAAIYETAARHGIMTPTHPLIYKEAVWKPADGPMLQGKAPLACRANWVYPPRDIAAICKAAVPSEYSTFSSVVYSVDVAIPVVNFRMESDWSPRVVDWQTGDTGIWYNPATWQAGWWVRLWEWVQIAFGWVLSLLFVSAIGGVIRRD